MIKQAEIDAAKAKIAAAKALAMSKALAGNALRRFESTPVVSNAQPKPPLKPNQLKRFDTFDERALEAKLAAAKGKQAQIKQDAAQMIQKHIRAALARKARRRKQQEDAAKIIQKHIRGALARMSSAKITRENRAEALMKKLAAAARRLENGEEFTEAELQQLAADMAEVLAMLKVCAPFILSFALLLSSVVLRLLNFDVRVVGDARAS